MQPGQPGRLRGGQAELEKQDDPIKRTIKLPLNGETALLLRAAQLPESNRGTTLGEADQDPKPFAAEVDPLLTYEPAPEAAYRQPACSPPTEAEIVRQSLDPADAERPTRWSAAGKLRTLGRPTSVRPTSPSRRRRWPSCSPRREVAAPERDQWLRLKYYIETLNSNDPKVPNYQQGHAADNRAEILKILPDVFGMDSALL